MTKKKETDTATSDAAPTAESKPKIRCCWCFAPREVPLDRKGKCGSCGKHGTTTREEKQVRNIYVEEIPNNVVL